MSVTLANILRLPAFAGAQVLTGASGLENEVGGISLLESPDSIQWTSAGDFIITNAYFLKNTQENVVQIVRALAEKGASGLALKLNRYWETVPESMLELAASLSFPIVSLPFQAAPAQLINAVVYEVMHEEFHMAGSQFVEAFLKELLFTEFDPALMQKKARLIGFLPHGNMGVMLAWPQQGLSPEDMRKLVAPLLQPGEYALIHVSYLIVTAVIPPETPDRMQLLAEALLHNTPEPAEGISCHIGIGRASADFSGLSNSHYEAKTAMLLAHTHGETIMAFERLGVFRILFDAKNIEALKLLYTETIGLIEKTDAEHNTEFLATIKTFLQQSGSIRDTANAMYVHYNTIRYRLKKIRDLIGIDLAREESHLDMSVCIEYHNLLHLQEKLP